MIKKTEPPIYEICLKESLSCDRAESFEGMQLIIQADGSSLITGPLVDQAALFGLLNTIALLGLTLISVNQVEASPNVDCAES